MTVLDLTPTHYEAALLGDGRWVVLEKPLGQRWVAVYERGDPHAEASAKSHALALCTWLDAKNLELAELAARWDATRPDPSQVEFFYRPQLPDLIRDSPGRLVEIIDRTWRHEREWGPPLVQSAEALEEASAMIVALIDARVAEARQTVINDRKPHGWAEQVEAVS